jgi:hypothetical protein
MDEIDSRSNSIYVPQTFPVSQLELDVLPKENDPPLAGWEAKMEIFLKIFWLWQAGQVTSLILAVFWTSSSNGLPQSVQINS